ncbi:hypothetical protein MY4824_005045 [Beauveria thailandica]
MYIRSSLYFTSRRAYPFKVFISKFRRIIG